MALALRPPWTGGYIPGVTLRSVVAALTAVLVMHLSVLGVDRACATYGAGTAASMASMQDAPRHEASPDTRDATASHQTDAGHHEPCETPVRAHCCDALASCSVAALASAADAAGWPTEHAARDAAPSLALRSLTAAPETPPPRA